MTARDSFERRREELSRPVSISVAGWRVDREEYGEIETTCRDAVCISLSLF